MTASDLITEALAYCRARVADMRLWGVVLPELAAALKSREAEVARLRTANAEMRSRLVDVEQAHLDVNAECHGLHDIITSLQETLTRAGIGRATWDERIRMAVSELHVARSEAEQMRRRVAEVERERDDARTAIAARERVCDESMRHLMGNDPQ